MPKILDLEYSSEVFAHCDKFWSGIVMIVVGTGSTMKQAKAQAYARVANIRIPGMYYRDDIGERWAEDSDLLHTWGYLRGV